MYFLLFRYLLPGCLLAMPASLLASPISSDSELTGVYYILTDSKPYPLLSINLGEVRSIYGQLTDEGCDISDETYSDFTTDLNSLFHAVEISEFESGHVLSKNWEQNAWDGENPFAGSSVTLNISDRAELDLVHTIITYSDYNAEWGSELCRRSHHYQMRAVE